MPNPSQDIFSLIGYVLYVVHQLLFLFWGLAVVLFLFGLVKFVKNAADTDAHEEGKHLMVWGIIAFFVLVTLWGLVSFLVESFQLDVANPTFIDKNGSSS